MENYTNENKSSSKYCKDNDKLTTERIKEGYNVRDYNVAKFNKRGSVLGYVFGLTGSIFSIVFCFIMFCIGFWFKSLTKDLFYIFMNIIYEIFDIDHPFGFGLFMDESFRFLIPIFIVILIGAVLGLIGTIKSFGDVSVGSSTLMLVSGVLLLFCFVIPGILLIIGGTLNLRHVLNDKG